MCLFDLDGTILDTIEDLCAACNVALLEFGLPTITVQQTKRYLGHGIRSLIEHASNFHPQSEDVLKVFHSHYKGHYNDKTKPFPGILEVLSYCKSKGVIVGVLTNKVEDIASSLCEAHFKDFFQFICGDKPGRIRKPDPATLLSLIDQYHLSKEEVLMIGDSEVDFQTAENAGVDSLILTYGFRSKEELTAYSKQMMCIDSAADIRTYLNQG